MNTPHVMQLVEVAPDGGELWQCATCGRTLRFWWPPNYKKIIVAPGDEFVAHTGAGSVLGFLGGFRAETSLGVFQDNEACITFGPDTSAEGLDPWLRWMREEGLAE